jgi:glucose-6-phosphate 1-dehydrogenase
MAGEQTSIVIMGATGDLARRKLIPALFQLACKRRLPAGLRVVGFARPRYSDVRFRELAREGMQEFADLAVREKEWTAFARNLHYVGGDLGVPDDFIRLAQFLDDMENPGVTANRMYYLSIAPRFFAAAIENLGTSGLAGEGRGWRRVVI